MVAWAIPLVLVGAVELALRMGGYGGDQRLFAPGTGIPSELLVANRGIGVRYFPFRDRLPTFPKDPFLSTKPAHGYRAFVLGESAAAGFPYGYNGTFSRMLQEALATLLPDDTVEVVNLGVAAVSSYAWADQIDEVLAQHPDVVLIYGGHNEFYGVLGAGSTVRIAAPPGVVRAALRLQRWRVALWLRQVTLRLAGGRRGGSADSAAAVDPLMRAMARQETIPLGSATVLRAARQYESNLRYVINRCRAAGVPVFLGSLVSNLRDQAPFAPPSDSTGAAAAALFAVGKQRLGAGDGPGAREAFAEARDQDGFRFRAPGSFNQIVQSVSREAGVRYVAVAEVFDSAARDRIPGSDLFWEHVHPTLLGHRLLAEVFLGEMMRAGFSGHRVDSAGWRGWDGVVAAMAITDYDQHFATHQVALLTSRWPFRPEMRSGSLLRAPETLSDTIAVLAVLGRVSWPEGKAMLAKGYAERGQYGAAIAELRGLSREYPWDTDPVEFGGQLALKSGDIAQAWTLLARAYRIRPTIRNAEGLGSIALGQGQPARALPYLEQAARLAPGKGAILYDLSRATAMLGDTLKSREYAETLMYIEPNYPGLREWLELIGGVSPAEKR
jgi:lysophospholipase L1-like esterase